MDHRQESHSATEREQLARTWHRIGDTGVDRYHTSHEAFCQLLPKHSAFIVELIGRDPPVSASGRISLGKMLAAVRDDLDADLIGDALLKAIPTHASILQLRMDTVLATGIGRRDLVDLGITAGMQVIPVNEATPDAWLGRSLVLHGHRSEDLAQTLVRGSHLQVHADDLRASATMLAEAVVATTKPRISCANAEGSLIDMANRCTNLGAATMARAVACLHWSVSDGDAWRAVACDPMPPDRLVAADWNTMSDQDQQVVISTALRVAMQPPREEAIAMANLFLTASGTWTQRS